MTPSPRLPRWTPYAVAAALMLAGWLNLVRGAAHPGVPYRPWAFDHHSYSDILAMGGDRYFHGGRPTPFLDDRIEYPPLLALALWLPSFVSRDPALFFTATYVALAALALATVWALSRIPGANPWWFAGSLALVHYTGLNWDHLPIALTAAAALATTRGHPARAGAWLALGTSAKLFPAALLPGVLGALSRRRAWGALGAGAAAFVGVTLAVNLPVAIASPRNWTWFWRFNGGRHAENSIWEVLRHFPALKPLALDAAFLNGVTFALLAAASAFAAWGAWRASGPGAPDSSGPRAVCLALGVVLVTWVATNKVYSPQYALYVALAGALAAAPTRLFWAVSVISAIDYHVAFETRASRGLIRYFDAVYTTEEVLRTAIFVAVLAWLARELLALGRRSAGAACGGSTELAS
ncbi:MAG TPA: glycosyltransferase 87 family protein [Anaeromyxobacteraceae bacterium]|nr:glycosyltransferase 87 family protein [Anaeromyxobacteraceae bacterium]